MAKALLVLPDKILLDWGSFHNPSKAGLVCLDPLTGQETWRYDRPQGYLESMELVGGKTLVLSQGDLSTGDSGPAYAAGGRQFATPDDRVVGD